MPHTDDVYEIAPDLAGAGLSIGIAMSRFNEPVCAALLRACLDQLFALGVGRDDISVVTVPGALELPVALQRLARTGQFHALIALGAVIRGETYHFELVANESAAGVSRVALDAGLPVANGVLTTDTDEQAEARMHVKGADCARVAVEMVNLLAAIDDERD